MFYHFLRQYKCNIYNNNDPFNWKIFTWPEWLLQTLFAICVFSSVFLFSKNYNSECFIPLLLSLIPLYLFIKALNKRLDKERAERFERYKVKKLEPLIDLLNELGFCKLAKIDWLLQCCDEELSRPQKERIGVSDIFLKFIFPCLTLLLGSLIKEINLETGLMIGLCIILIFLIICLFQISIKPWINHFLYPDHETIHFLKKELQFIRTNLTDMGKNEIS